MLLATERPGSKTSEMMSAEEMALQLLRHPWYTRRPEQGQMPVWGLSVTHQLNLGRPGIQPGDAWSDNPGGTG